MTETEAQQIDQHVGLRLRARRIELGLSQTEVADHLGVSFQQVQKYERAFDRISASRLFDLCSILQVKIDFFFEGLSEAADEVNAESLSRPDVIELANAYMNIPEQIRHHLRRLIHEISKDHPQNFEVSFRSKADTMGTRFRRLLIAGSGHRNQIQIATNENARTEVIQDALFRLAPSPTIINGAQKIGWAQL